MGVKGVDAVVAKLKRVSGPEFERGIGQALFVTGQTIQVDAQISITDGAVSGKGHVPSRPGEPPKNDTGGLANNIETVQVAPLRVEVSSNAEYSIPLEFGTSKMAARPFMKPAAGKNRDTLQKNVKAVVSQMTRKR